MKSAFLIIVLTLLAQGVVMSVQEKARVRAPEITGGRGWLNTDKPLSIAALKGKVVLLDFWTYGCINCIHIIPDLKKLEEKYANQLVVIGVHSAKFQNEKETENIRRIILRYEIEHPVYNDSEYAVWQSYGVRAWPTQVLIDPAGYVIGGVSGEGNYEVIDQAIAKDCRGVSQKGRTKRRTSEARSRTSQSRRSATCFSRQDSRGRQSRSTLHRRLKSQPHRYHETRRHARRHNWHWR